MFLRSTAARRPSWRLSCRVIYIYKYIHIYIYIYIYTYTSFLSLCSSGQLPLADQAGASRIARAGGPHSARERRTHRERRAGADGGGLRSRGRCQGVGRRALGARGQPQRAGFLGVPGARGGVRALHSLYITFHVRHVRRRWAGSCIIVVA